MANRYPPEVHQFIAANVEGRTCKELAELTNREMGTAFTETMMHSYKHNHGLKSGTKCGKPKGWRTSSAAWQRAARFTRSPNW